jgi:hypothetical protein
MKYVFIFIGYASVFLLLCYLTYKSYKWNLKMRSLFCLSLFIWLSAFAFLHISQDKESAQDSIKSIEMWLAQNKLDGTVNKNVNDRITDDIVNGYFR